MGSPDFDPVPAAGEHRGPVYAGPVAGSLSTRGLDYL
jgi:hypothetical protein